MKIFKIRTDSNKVQMLNLSDSSKVTLEGWRFDGLTKSSSWNLESVYIDNPLMEPKDFYLYGLGVLVFNERVLSVCGEIFEMSGEILPMQIERGPKVYLLNILQCMNGLDYEKTKWDYYKDGTKGRILEYAFHPERVINESSIFKIPETVRSDIFCHSEIGDPDYDFYKIYHKNGFTGLTFKEVFNGEVKFN
jgi:hypothetical protein